MHRSRRSSRISKRRVFRPATNRKSQDMPRRPPRSLRASFLLNRCSEGKYSHAPKGLDPVRPGCAIKLSYRCRHRNSELQDLRWADAGLVKLGLLLSAICGLFLHACLRLRHTAQIALHFVSCAREAVYLELKPFHLGAPQRGQCSDVVQYHRDRYDVRDANQPHLLRRALAGVLCSFSSSLINLMRSKGQSLNTSLAGEHVSRVQNTQMDRFSEEH